MAKSNGKGRLLPNGRFLSIPHAVTDTEKFARLSSWSIRLLVDLCRQYNGHNNGDLCSAWSVMKKRGWRSRGTLNRSIQELLEFGFIELTRQGGRNQPNLYALSWHAVDECKDGARMHKLDVKPTRTASGLWHD